MALILIATKNEEDSIEFLLEKLKDHRVIIVDDSNDKTPEIVQKFSNVDFLKGPNSGIADAYIAGFIFAMAYYPDERFIIQMDAGGTHNPDDIKRLLECDGDLVIGSRRFKWRGIRTLISKTAAFMMRLEIGDVTSGFRRWSMEILKSMDFSSIVSTGFSFQLETLYQAHKLGADIREVFIDYRLTNSTFNYRMLLEALYVYIIHGMFKSWFMKM